MGKMERRFLEFFERNIIWFLYAFITLAALALRWQFIDWRSPDYSSYLEPWFLELKAAGGLKGLGQVIGDYNVLYLFLMALLTYVPLEPIVLIKGLSIAMDFLGAFAGALLCRGKERGLNHMTSVMAYGILLLLPNVFVNSSVWAQCDFSYTAFIMFGIVLLLQDRFRWAVIAFGIAFCFKLQAVFFLPVLLVYYVSKKKFSILEFLWWPAVWILTSLPAVLMGRSIRSVAMIYRDQVTLYHWLTLSYPNIYQLFQKTGSEMETYALFSEMAILLTLAVLGIGCVYAVRKKMVFDCEELLGFSAWCAFTCVLFLPAMHERYGFLAEILTVCYAFVKKNAWSYVTAILNNGVSIIIYVAMMFGTIQLSYFILALFNIMAYVLLTYQVLLQGRENGGAGQSCVEEISEARA